MLSRQGGPCQCTSSCRCVRETRARQPHQQMIEDEEGALLPNIWADSREELLFSNVAFIEDAFALLHST